MFLLFFKSYDAVLYELITDDELTCVDAVSGLRRLRSEAGVCASPASLQLAAAYGFTDQLSGLDPSAPEAADWILAESREALSELQQAEDFSKGDLILAGARGQLTAAELAQARKLATGLGQFHRALTLQTSPSQRLRGSLLPESFYFRGEAFSNALSALLWLAPVPEVNLLAYDTGALRRGTLARETLVAVLSCLGRGDWRAVKQVLLAQELSAEQADDGRGEALIGARNAYCVEELTKWLNSQSLGLGGAAEGSEVKPKKVAVLFGGLHCRDLEVRLGASFGAKRIAQGEPQWRSAWVIEEGHNVQGPDSTHVHALHPAASSTSKSLLPVVATVVPFYFLVGALDWLTELRTLVDGGVDGGILGAEPWPEVVLELVLYVVRHSVLLIGISKIAVDWDTRT